MGKERPRVVPQTIHKLRPFVLPAAPGDPPVDKPRVCPSSGDGRCSLGSLEERAGICVVQKLQRRGRYAKVRLLSEAEEVAAGSGSSQLP